MGNFDINQFQFQPNLPFSEQLQISGAFATSAKLIEFHFSRKFESKVLRIQPVWCEICIITWRPCDYSFESSIWDIETNETSRCIVSPSSSCRKQQRRLDWQRNWCNQPMWRHFFQLAQRRLLSPYSQEKHPLRGDYRRIPALFERHLLNHINIPTDWILAVFRITPRRKRNRKKKRTKYKWNELNEWLTSGLRLLVCAKFPFQNDLSGQQFSPSPNCDAANSFLLFFHTMLF